MTTLYSAAAIRQTRRINPTRQVTLVFKNPPTEKITELLSSARIIAIVGLSADPSRPSNRVARQLQGFGYRIIPVTPAGGPILGEQAVAGLDHLPGVLKSGERIDVVDVFRRPEHVAAIVDDCIRLGMPALWLQDGVIDETAAEKAARAGIFTVMDRCMFRDRAALG
jgi:predicted CoA-binding protein